tara:strand:- start:5 stop:541 length:537 start_codon:yes stop_codon:yes gene_type:complete
MTTRDLVDLVINTELEILVETDSEKLLDLEQSLQVLQTSLRTKVDKLDYFLVEVNRKAGIIDTEIEVYKDEIQRLKNRKQAATNTKNFFNQVLLPMVIQEVGNEDGVWQTDTARYKLYETYGPVLIDAKELDKKYVTVEIIESVDKKAARADAMIADREGRELPAGVGIYKVKRVKRS